MGEAADVNFEALIGAPVLDEQGSGGLRELRLEDGRTALAKRAHAPGATWTEAAGLRWLAASETVPVPEVFGADDDWLVLEKVPRGRPGHPAAFGAALARLHASGAPAFGAPPPRAGQRAWIGLTTMPVVEADSWPEWYAEHRVRHYLRECVDARALDRSEAQVIEQVCERLPELAGPAEPPARLHGDLWTGNVLWAPDGTAWLIDPAAHGGHRETDLAMLALFGCPRLEEILAAYQEQAPLADGWRARIPLHQLFPLLVHTVLFGGGYGAQAVSAARASLRIG